MTISTFSDTVVRKIADVLEGAASHPRSAHDDLVFTSPIGPRGKGSENVMRLRLWQPALPIHEYQNEAYSY